MYIYHKNIIYFLNLYFLKVYKHFFFMRLNPQAYQFSMMQFIKQYVK